MTYYDEIVGKTFIDGEQLLYAEIERKASQATAKEAEFLRSMTNLEKIQFENLVWSWSARIKDYGVECENIMREAERWAGAQVLLQREHGVGVEFRRELNKLIDKLKSKGTKQHDQSESFALVETGTAKTNQESTTGISNPGSDNQISDTSRLVRDTDQLQQSDGGRTTDPVLHSAKWRKRGL